VWVWGKGKGSRDNACNRWLTPAVNIVWLCRRMYGICQVDNRCCPGGSVVLPVLARVGVILFPGSVFFVTSILAPIQSRAVPATQEMLTLLKG